MMRWCRTRLRDAADYSPICQPRIRPLPCPDRVDHHLRLEAAGDYHRATIKKDGPVTRAAPQHEPVPFRRPLVRCELLTHIRMNAVSADEHIGLCRGDMAIAAIEEPGRDPCFVLAAVAQPAVRMNRRSAEPRNDGIAQHPLQSAPMDRELGYAMADMHATLFTPDLLAEAI